MPASSNRLEIVDIETGRVAVRGELDAHTATLLTDHLAVWSPTVSELALDLSGVSFIDSSGLRVLIETHQRAVECSYGLVLESPSHTVSRLLEIAGLDGHFVIR
jgi:anti-anti-sigma factor